MMPLKSAGLKLRPVITPQEQDQKLKDAAAMYEQQFLQTMIKSMRSTITESDLIPTSAGEKIFREELDNEYANQWGKQGGIGLQKLIYDQMIEKFGPQLGLSNLSRPNGPIAMNEKALLKPGVHTHPRFKLNYELNPPMDSRDVLSPWSGVLTAKSKIDDKNTLLELKHGNGISSRLSFNGSAEALSVGDEIAAGQRVGSLSSEAQSVFWGLE
jgi:flagellar protein FlgJ